MVAGFQLCRDCGYLNILRIETILVVKEFNNDWSTLYAVGKRVWWRYPECCQSLIQWQSDLESPIFALSLVGT